MSNPFSHLKKYQELTPYLEVARKVLDGEYIADLEEIKEKCLKNYKRNIPWGEKGIESLPSADYFFREMNKQNEENLLLKENSEINRERKKSLERAFE